MNFLKTFRLGVAALVLPVVLLSSAVGQDGAVLLYKQNYSEAVSFSKTDAPLLRDFYVVLGNQAEKGVSPHKIVITPVQTPSLSGKFSGSFIVDTATLNRSHVALQYADSEQEKHADALRLFVGHSAPADSPASHNKMFPREAALAIVDSLLPIRTLSFVRFDVKEWEVLDSVVSYDIDISFWGRPAEASPEHVTTKGS
jgi:hypothetical protein